MRKFLFILIVCITFSCGTDDNSPGPTDDFDRKTMLTNWADNIIIPGLEAMSVSLDTLVERASAFTTSPNEVTLAALRTEWAVAYQEWQRIAMFEIGKAEEIQLINKFNLYPTDESGIAENIETGTYNLDLPSQRTRQGFPALDYLLYGLAATDMELLEVYNEATDGEAHKAYLIAVVNQMKILLDTVKEDWQNGYRETFINNDGNSATAAVDRLVNDYIFYYERFLRAGKVGIPAGVFSGSPLGNTVEAYHRRDLSKTLLLTSLDAVQQFFNGDHFDGNGNGQSLADYILALGAKKEGLPLNLVINDQFGLARSLIMGLNDDFVAQIEEDNAALLSTYDALQLNVINLKVDMLQVLNINVDYVDADGD